MSRLAWQPDPARYQPVEWPTPSQTPQAPPVSGNVEPGPEQMMRCPLPPLTSNPDSLRQFYRRDYPRLVRVISPKTLF